jgi:hypothetical protein
MLSCRRRCCSQLNLGTDVSILLRHQIAGLSVLFILLESVLY